MLAFEPLFCSRLNNANKSNTLCFYIASCFTKHNYRLIDEILDNLVQLLLQNTVLIQCHTLLIFEFSWLHQLWKIIRITCTGAFKKPREWKTIKTMLISLIRIHLKLISLIIYLPYIKVLVDRNYYKNETRKYRIF